MHEPEGTHDRVWISMPSRFARLDLVRACKVLASVPSLQCRRPCSTDVRECLGTDGLFDDILARESDDAGDSHEVLAIVLAKISGESRYVSTMVDLIPGHRADGAIGEKEDATEHRPGRSEGLVEFAKGYLDPSRYQ